MFKKLLSNLPFNPSLIGQVSFYAKRMNRETAIRRAGFILCILAFLIQLFAFLSPAQPTLAEQADNDIIRNGFTTRDQAAVDCRTNLRNFGDIMSYYHVSCDTLANAETTTIKSTFTDGGRKLNSLGRIDQGATIYRTGKATNEYPVDIAGGPYYMKDLSAWDSGAYSTYKVLKMTNTNGGIIYVMYDCGNIITIGRYLPVNPTPTPTPPVTPPPAKPKCPLDNSIDKSDVRCVPCPYNANILKGSSSCIAPKCPLDNTINADSSRCKSCPYNPQILRDNPKCQQCPYPGLSTIGKDSPYCKEPCPYNSGITKDSSDCKPCDKSSDATDITICLIQHKTARNITKDISNANGTMASGGDTIEYTLSVKNDSKIDAKGYVIEENLADILEYSDGADLNGGVVDTATKIIKWPAQNIPHGGTISRKFTMKVKNPVPQTPEACPNASSNTTCARSNSFDLAMTNVYGDTINITLPPTITKTTEQVIKTLPNTGPGEGLVATFSLTVIVSYFFARSRLMAKELNIVRMDYANSGSA